MEGISDKLGGLSLAGARPKSEVFHKISSSQYGMYVSLNCSLFVRRSASREKAGGVAAGTNNVGQRMQLRGSNWEDRICIFLKDQAVVDREQQYLDCTNEHFENTLRAILKANSPVLEIYMYQATMDIAEEFVPSSLLAVNATVSRIIPDLLKLHRKSVRDPWVLMVIDAKSSLNLKQSHQAQVAFYSYFLERIFQKEIAEGVLQMSAVGGVWLQPAETVSATPLTAFLEEFQLKPWLQLVNQHLMYDIPAALACPIEDVPWHLSASCGSCPYLSDCSAPKAYGVDLRTLPHVSRADSKFLQKLAVEYCDGPTVAAAALHRTKCDKYAVQTLRDAIAARADDAQTHARALKILGSSPESAAAGNFGSLSSALDQRAIVKGHMCGLLPASTEGVAVFITLHCDPALDLPCAYGVALSVNGTPSGSHHISALMCDRGKDSSALRADEHAMLLSFLILLCDIIDEHGNRSPACKLSFYVWEGLEKYCLNQLVIKSLCGEFGTLPGQLKQRVHYLALVVLDYPQQWDLMAPAPPMQGDLARSPAVGAICNSCPRVCDVTQAFKSLLHLPVPGFYTPAGIHGWVSKPTSHDAAQNIALAHIERVWTTPGNIEELVRARLQALMSATNYLRSTVVAHDRSLLFNSSPPLPDRTHLRAPLPAASPLIERLLFMKEVDALVRCSNARQKRIAALNSSTALVRLRCVTVGATRCTFEQLSGSPVFSDNPASAHIRKWCLAPDRTELIAGLSDIQHLVDKSYCTNPAYRFVTVASASMQVVGGGAVRTLQIDLSGNAALFVKEKGSYIMFEREVDLNITKSLDSLSQAALGTVPATYEAVLQDPNRWDSEFQQSGQAATLADLPCTALDQSRLDVNTVYRTVTEHTGDDASPFAKVGPLTGVQARAFQMLLHERLTIVWGPPGTGKTHFAAKSILNLIEMVARQSVPPAAAEKKTTRKGTSFGAAPAADKVKGLHILVTATTHAAIDEILGKFVAMKALAESIPGREDVAAWAGDNCKVFKFQSKTAAGANAKPDLFDYTEGPTKIPKCRFAVVGATTWSLYKKDAYRSDKAFRELFDVVVIDEASQMPVADALMPLCCVKSGPGGRLLVIGDTLQLPPIFAHKFGPPPRGVPAMQGSILECLLRTADNEPVDLSGVIAGRVAHPPRMIKLSDNFRMNGALSRFTSRLYGQDYVPAGVSQNKHGRWAVSTAPGRTTALTQLVPGIVSATAHLPEIISIRLVPYTTTTSRSSAIRPLTEAETATTSELEHLAVESVFVSALVQALASCHATLSTDEAAGNIFACTPHNKQKAAITAELARLGHSSWSDIADTAERMQGQERDVVIICLGVFSAEVVSHEVDFLFSKQRLNVAISRAKKSCILVYTDALTALNPDVIGNPAANEAYEHLLEFISASGKAGSKYDVPVTFATL